MNSDPQTTAVTANNVQRLTAATAIASVEPELLQLTVQPNQDREEEQEQGLLCRFRATDYTYTERTVHSASAFLHGRFCCYWLRCCLPLRWQLGSKRETSSHPISLFLRAIRVCNILHGTWKLWCCLRIDLLKHWQSIFSHWPWSNYTKNYEVQTKHPPTVKQREGSGM